MPKPKSRKKFIDKKNSVTFNLVHRSQRDPLIADETAPQRVLVPVNAAVPPKREKEPELTPEQRKAEQQKYGVYFDDDYNYLQHLKDTREVTMLLQPKAQHKRVIKKENSTGDQEDDEEVSVKIIDNLMLPSSVFASEVEEDIGLLNKAAPQGLCLEVDPDVAAALDGDFDFDDPDNQLEDDFIFRATEGDLDEDEDDDENSEEMSDYSDDSGKANISDDDSDGNDSFEESPGRRGGRMPDWEPFAKEETKSRFSQYSMSSSVIRRNQGLTLLDNMFEKMMDTYDDTELGALDTEEIEGHMTERNEMLLKAAEEYENMQSKFKLDKDKEMARLQRLQEIAEESSEEELDTVPVDEKEKWDCETILSTYSNLYNHPKLIDEPKKNKIKISSKSGLPMDILGKDTNRLTVKSLAKFNSIHGTNSDQEDDGETQAETVLSTLSVLSIRPTDETPEEKRERKRLLREYRKERRVEKKANREAFKEEKKRQEKILLNNRNNIQGNRIL